MPTTAPTGTHTDPDTVRSTQRRSFWGFTAILCCSLLLYNALLFSSLYNELWQNAEASAQVAGTTLKTKVAMGVRLGKELNTFRDIREILQNVGGNSQTPLAILDTRKNILHAWGQFPAQSALDTAFSDGTPPKANEPESQIADSVLHLPEGRCLISPILGRNGICKGYTGVYIAAQPIYAAMTAFCIKQLWVQGLSALLGLGLLWLLLRRVYVPTAPTTAPKSRYRLTTTHASLLVFLLIMLCNGSVAVYDVAQQYTTFMRNDALRTAAVLRNDLNRLMLVGVSLNNSYQIEGYLQRIAHMHHNSIALTITTDGKCFASSLGKEPTPQAILTDSVSSLPLVSPDRHAQGHVQRQSGGGVSLSGAKGTQIPDQPALGTHTGGWQLTVALLHAPWWGKLMSTCLDILTIVAIALIFMIEILLLLSRSLAVQKAAESHRDEKRSELFRPLMFFFLLAMDMSVSFIPLRMAEMTPATEDAVQLLGLSLSKELLLGLPISAEMAMTGISVLIAGVWLKKYGARLPFITGIACVAAGYCFSMLAQEPWQFITARALSGLGYGFTLLTAQAVTVKNGKLADMFAGVYAGSLCGSALGAMLAERFGYAPVFGVSACILTCLVIVPCVLLRQKTVQAPPPVKDATTKAAAAPPDATAAPAAASDVNLASTAAASTTAASTAAITTDAAVSSSCPASAPPTVKKSAAGGMSTQPTAGTPWFALLWDRRLLGLLLLGVVPSAVITVGFLNYFLPIYLKSAGVEQSNIGRIYMLNCLITIYSGPVLATWVFKSDRKEIMVFVAGLLAAVALLSFVFLAPLPAALAGSVLLGFATGLNIPAYSEYLLERNIVKNIGIDQSMSLLDALQRLGQVLGPLCFGAALTLMPTENAALWAGAGFVGLSLFFMFVARGKECSLPAAHSRGGADVSS